MTRILTGLTISFVLYVGVSFATKPDFAKADAFIGMDRRGADAETVSVN